MRLKSRHPLPSGTQHSWINPYRLHRKIAGPSRVRNFFLVEIPEQKVSGFHLPHAQWITLTRIKTENTSVEIPYSNGAWT